MVADGEYPPGFRVLIEEMPEEVRRRWQEEAYGAQERYVRRQAEEREREAKRPPPCTRCGAATIHQGRAEVLEADFDPDGVPYFPYFERTVYDVYRCPNGHTMALSVEEGT